jgi:hypothetical protein
MATVKPPWGEVFMALSFTTRDDTQQLTSPLLPGFGVAIRFLLDG